MYPCFTPNSSLAYINSSPSDEDIPTPLPSFSIKDDIAQDKSNEIRIGPITRARAKLLEQQVNSLLVESDICVNQNFILPKSLHICMIRFEGKASLARGDEELQQEELLLMSNISKCTREEREAGAQHKQKENQNRTRIDSQEARN